MSEPKPTYTTYRDRFDDILAEMSALHSKKGADYGGVNDPYANVRASQEFGVPPWIGALVRLHDKITRIKSFIRNGNLQNESLKDSIDDIGVYAVIMRLLYEEEQEAEFPLDPYDYDPLPLAGREGIEDAKYGVPLCYCEDKPGRPHFGHLKGYDPMPDPPRDAKGGLIMSWCALQPDPDDSTRLISVWGEPVS